MDMDMLDGADNQEDQLGQPEEGSDLHRQIMSDLKKARRHRYDWRVEKRSLDDFEAGRQWSEDDLAVLKDQQRPAVVFNLTCKTYNAVSGTEIQNPRETTYFPREINDGGYSDDMNQLAKWARDSCDARSKESDAFRECFKSGEGWMEQLISYEQAQDGEGEILFNDIDSMNMVVDRNSCKRNYLDARFLAHIKEMDKREYKEKFPDSKFAADSFWGVDVESPVDVTHIGQYEGEENVDQTRDKTMWVAQYQCYTLEPYYILKVKGDNNQILEFSESKFKKMKEQLEAAGIGHIKYMKRIYKEYMINSEEILEEKTLECGHFTFFAITGIFDKKRRQFFGLGRLMKDPQMWANKWLSQIQHILNTSAKNGYLAEKGAFANINKAKEDLAKPGAIVELNAGGLQKILQQEAPRYPDGIDRLLQYALQSINNTAGVNLELLGLAERDQAIGLEDTRKQAGITMLAPFFESLNLYHKVSGRVLAYNIREYLSDGRMARVLGPNGMKSIPIIKDRLSFKYNIVVGDAPTSTNQKERNYPIITQIVQIALQAGLPIPPEILDYAPLPDNLIQKWKETITNSQNSPQAQEMQQVKQALAQLEVKLKQAEIQKTISEAQENMAQANQAQATGQDESAQAMQKMGMAHQEHQMGLQQVQGDIMVREMEAQHKAKLKTLETAHSLKLKKVESDAKIQMQREQSTAKAQMLKMNQQNKPKRSK